MQPLLDLLLPTCDPVPAFLREAIESALAQTERRWRMVIRDDASGSDVRSIVEPYLADPRISFTRGETRLGIGGSWNACVRLSSAPYVQFLFQDDRWKPELLARGTAVLERHPDVGLVSFGHTYDFEEPRLAVHSLYRQVEEFRAANIEPGTHDGRSLLRFWLKHELTPNIIGEPDFLMVRRSLLESVGPFLEDMPQNLDVEWSVRALLHANWYYVKEHCGSFRVHARATSALNRREGIGVFDRFRCFQTLIELLPPGQDRSLALTSRNRALADMARKFLRRVRGGPSERIFFRAGKRTAAGGSGGKAFRSFAIRHPFLIARAILGAFHS